ncbi:MAG TPA: HAMP domain-containing sensor histidine kinase [Gemmatimonadales bacterium]|nr:HAMP domain-containing sensor histidine kinase [Gemmatimonadales bacterium]
MSTSRGFLTLPRRLALITGLLAILLVVGSTELALSLSERVRLGDLQVESVELATTLAEDLSRMAPTGEPQALGVGLLGWSRRHITETTAIVFLLTTNGLEPAAWSDSTVSQLPSRLDLQALQARETKSWLRRDSSQVIEVAVPLGGDTIYGILHVQVSTGRLAEWAQLERRRALLLALSSALLLGIGVSFLVARWVGRPLASLTATMAGAHGGAEGSPVAPEIGPPEFRELAQRYNALRDALRTRQQESDARAALLALEEAARGYDRLAQADEIATGFAHEIGTPLNTMNGHLQLMREDLRARGDGQEERVDLLLEQIDRVTKIVRGRLERGGWPVPSTQPVDLEHLCQRMLRFMEPALATAGVTAQVRTGTPGSARVMTDADLIEQILLNLLKNAIEALPRGGQITLASGRSNGTAWIDVTDDGPGLSSDVRSHLFQPFVTSKGHEGSGLGLTVSRRLARMLGGDLALQPSARGTAWRLSLPLVDTHEAAG